MGNAYWFEQQRAKGICYICKRPMSDSDPNLTHSECVKLRNSGKTYKEVQEIVKAKRLEANG